MAHGIQFEPDSDTYIRFSPHRTAGYPLYLNTLGVTAAVKFQPVLYVLALIVLWRETARFLDGTWLASLLVLGCLINPIVNSYHFTVLTESLFMTLQVLLMSCILRFLRTPSIACAGAAAALVALAAMVRPSGYALFLLLPVMVLLCWRDIRRNRWSLLAAALVPALALIGLERAAASAYHGAAATSLAGRHLYAKAALIDAPPAAPSDDARERVLQTALEVDYAPVREILRSVPRWDVRESMSDDYETCLEGACSRAVNEALGLPGPEINRLAMRVALARIGQVPFAFAALALDRYRSLWTALQLNDPAAAQVFNAFVVAHRPLPFEALVPSFSQTPRPSRLAEAVRPALLAIGASTLALAVFGCAAALFRRLDARLAAAVLAALAVHLSLAFTALVSVGILRYTFGMWPMIVAALVFAAAWLIRIGRARGLRLPGT